MKNKVFYMLFVFLGVLCFSSGFALETAVGSSKSIPVSIFINVNVETCGTIRSAAISQSSGGTAIAYYYGDPSGKGTGLNCAPGSCWMNKPISIDPDQPVIVSVSGLYPSGPITVPSGILKSNASIIVTCEDYNKQPCSVRAL